MFMRMKFVEKRGLERHETLKHTRESTSKTAEKIKKTVSPTLQIGQFEKIVKEFAKYVMEVNVCLKLHKKYIKFL